MPYVVLRPEQAHETKIAAYHKVQENLIQFDGETRDGIAVPGKQMATFISRQMGWPDKVQVSVDDINGELQTDVNFPTSENSPAEATAMSRREMIEDWSVQALNAQVKALREQLNADFNLRDASKSDKIDFILENS